MSELSLRERIQRYFDQRPDLWQNGGEIERMALDAGYKASNASRRPGDSENWQVRVFYKEKKDEMATREINRFGIN